ncbi:MAG: hypothetical protein K0U68_12155 [Gammaproteobacteria bacterium]|nr:hypothetical protein [Gammaproteobacteria bacterium]
MSYKASVIKLAINMTPDYVMRCVTNLILKDIAKLTDFTFDLNSRTAQVTFNLSGDPEPITVSVNGFEMTNEDGRHNFILHKAESDRQWVHAILNKVAGKGWKIPVIPRFQSKIDLVAEVLSASDQ